MTDQGEVGDEMLMLLADGELQGAEADALRQRVQADPALAERYAVFVETRALLKEVYLAGPMPDRLIRTAMETPMGAAAEGLRRQRLPRATAPGLALAASLMLAVGIAGFLAGRGTAPLQVAGDPVTIAAETLSGSPTGEGATLPGGQTVRALASFQTDLGLCRLIAMDATRAVVCRGESGWTTALAVSGGEGAAFLPAADPAAELIDVLLDQIGAGAPLDPEAERAALAR